MQASLGPVGLVCVEGGGLAGHALFVVWMTPCKINFELNFIMPCRKIILLPILLLSIKWALLNSFKPLIDFNITKRALLKKLLLLWKGFFSCTVF